MAMLGAVVGAAALDPTYAHPTKRGAVTMTLAGFDDGTLPLCTILATEGCAFNPYEAAMMRRARRLPHVIHTSTNSEMVPKSVWARSAWVNEYLRPARVDHYLGTTCMVGPDGNEGVGILRAAGDRPFSDVDRATLHLLRLETHRLFHLPAIALAPRVRATLEWVLTGASDKEIAERMNLSPHTVRQYVKTIFKAYGVSRRAQLVAQVGRGLVPPPV